ncbi:hypothetical protein pb186bvf_014449 [Paramecium bursaria]
MILLFGVINQKNKEIYFYLVQNFCTKTNQNKYFDIKLVSLAKFEISKIKLVFQKIVI